MAVWTPPHWACWPSATQRAPLFYAWNTLLTTCLLHYRMALWWFIQEATMVRCLRLWLETDFFFFLAIFSMWSKSNLKILKMWKILQINTSQLMEIYTSFGVCRHHIYWSSIIRANLVTTLLKWGFFHLWTSKSVFFHQLYSVTIEIRFSQTSQYCNAKVDSSFSEVLQLKWALGSLWSLFYIIIMTPV